MSIWIGFQLLTVFHSKLGGINIKPNKKNDMEKKLDSYDALMEEWQSHRPEYEYFSDDGILIDGIWEKTFPKIMFLLKEPNSDFTKIRGKAYQPTEGNSRLFWRNINIWQYIITEYWNNRTPLIEKISVVKENEVNAIAYVNLKKYNENNSISDPRNILDYVKDDCDFLQRQIELINPEIIVCGRTFNFYKELFSTQLISENVYRTKNRLIIDFYHPACRIGYNETFHRLTDIISNDIVRHNMAEIESCYNHTV